MRLLGMLPDDIDAAVVAAGGERYRADQLLRAVYRDGATSIEDVRALPIGLRARLAETLDGDGCSIVRTVVSEDGETTKSLLRMADGTLVETVLMLYAQPGAHRRNTVCVSTQAGCAMGCVFCATGQMGFERNLSAADIVAQVLHFSRLLREQGDRVTNVVFMGMGEPLANYEATVRAVRILCHPRALGLGQRKITISTVGIVHAIDRLADEHLQVGLAISLHAPDNALRRKLVPTASPTSVHDLVAAARRYFAATGRRVSYEYALIAGENDGEDTAVALARLLGPEHAHINLIPLNPTAGPYRRPSRNAVRRFKAILDAAGVNCTVRIEKGTEISAACGQLRTAEAATVSR